MYRHRKKCETYEAISNFPNAKKEIARLQKELNESNERVKELQNENEKLSEKLSCSTDNQLDNQEINLDNADDANDADSSESESISSDSDTTDLDDSEDDKE